LSIKLKQNSEKDNKEIKGVGQNNRIEDNVDNNLKPETLNINLNDDAIQEDSLDFLSKSIMMSNFKAD